MKIVLTPEESETIFHTALCNAESTGYMAGYGLQLRWHEESYKKAKDRLKERGEGICLEDILLEILRGGGHLTYFDIEGEAGQEPWPINLQDVHEKVSNAPARAILNFTQQQDDAEDADMILQTVFMGEILFG
jgi:hypothetical protein